MPHHHPFLQTPCASRPTFRSCRPPRSGLRSSVVPETMNPTKVAGASEYRNRALRGDAAIHPRPQAFLLSRLDSLPRPDQTIGLSLAGCVPTLVLRLTHS